MKIDGHTLIKWGFKPGSWFSDAIIQANSMRAAGCDDEAIISHMKVRSPKAPVTLPLHAAAIPYASFLEPQTADEHENVKGVERDMDALMRVPTVVSGAVMPDACPAGVIPVGGVVATKDAIHPGFHSADVCCSMAITVLERGMDLKRLLDAGQHITHFGPGGRKHDPFRMTDAMTDQFLGNSFLRDAVETGHSHLGTQGDGNHFLYVGRLRSTGQPAIVTHHGSRGVGAHLFKRGMIVAKRHTAALSPQTPSQAAWFDANSDDGRAYWDALQIVREWTRLNHLVLHNAIHRIVGNQIADRFWNEHNFVFRRDDGLYYHAKGATPSYAGFAPDSDGRTLIPMNMSESILITRPTDNPDALGFAPHGAGRNMSRTAFKKRLMEVYGDPRGLSPRAVEEIIRNQTHLLDARFHLGTPDVSELPGAYKDASSVIRTIVGSNLANIVDHVDPYGSIMAGEVSWQRKRK